MDQGIRVGAVQGVATASAEVGLAVAASAELLRRDQGAERLGMARLSPAFPPGRRSRWLSLQADGIGGRRLGGVGGVELQPSLEIAESLLQFSDPCVERVQEV
jgi:hypothetical protein